MIIVKRRFKKILTRNYLWQCKNPWSSNMSYCPCSNAKQKRILCEPPILSVITPFDWFSPRKCKHRCHKYKAEIPNTLKLENIVTPTLQDAQGNCPLRESVRGCPCGPCGPCGLCGPTTRTTFSTASLPPPMGDKPPPPVTTVLATYILRPLLFLPHSFFYHSLLWYLCICFHFPGLLMWSYAR